MDNLKAAMEDKKFPHSEVPPEKVGFEKLELSDTVEN
jgi:hypothetical protein